MLRVVLALAAFQHNTAVAQTTNLSDAEARMFAASAGNERFMGRWSRLLGPQLIAFAGVREGDRVLHLGAGTGSLGSTIEASMPASRIVGIYPSASFIAYAQKTVKFNRAHYEMGDAQAINYDDASFDSTGEKSLIPETCASATTHLHPAGRVSS